MGFLENLKKIQSFLQDTESNLDTSYADVVLEAAGIKIPLPTQDEVIEFYILFEELKPGSTPTNALTKIDPEQWTEIQYLRYQSDVRKYRRKQKYKAIKDAQELKRKKRQEKNTKKKNKAKTELDKQDVEGIKEATPEAYKPKGAQYFGILANAILKTTLSRCLPSLFDIVEQASLDTFEEKKRQAFEELGIEEQITELNQLTDPTKIEELRARICPSPEVLNNIINQRNGIIEFLNSQQDKLNNLKQGVNINTDLVNGAISTIDALTITAGIAEVTKRLAPVVTVFNIADQVQSFAEKIIDKIKFTRKGEPRIPKLESVANNFTIPLNQANNAFIKILLLVGNIDPIIAFCSPNTNLTPPSNALLTTYLVQTQANNSDAGNLYKGFRLEIETKKYSDTVNQNRAVGKNNSGIILIATEYSFASDPNVLIEEIKFIIDRDNLKAY